MSRQYRSQERSEKSSVQIHGTSGMVICEGNSAPWVLLGYMLTSMETRFS